MSANKRWTEKELEYLKKAYNSNTSIRQIAAILGRSKSAVQFKAGELGLRKYGDERRYTKEEEEELLKLGPESASVKNGRTLRACKKKYGQLMERKHYEMRNKKRRPKRFNAPKKIREWTDSETEYFRRIYNDFCIDTLTILFDTDKPNIRYKARLEGLKRK